MTYSRWSGAKEPCEVCLRPVLHTTLSKVPAAHLCPHGRRCVRTYRRGQYTDPCVTCTIERAVRALGRAAELRVEYDVEPQWPARAYLGAAFARAETRFAFLLFRHLRKGRAW